MKLIFRYLLIIVMPVLTQGQVYLSGLSTNPVLKTYLESKKGNPVYKSWILTYPGIYLPLRDDFSGGSVFPDSMMWIDRDAFVNAQYPIFPVDYGVATLDVLDSLGNFYSNASTFPFVADHLTSYPIRLDSVFDENHTGLWKITPADSVYLSFYYQPQGWGDEPLPNDSLVLQFGHYSGDSVFAYFDSMLVYGYNYFSEDTFLTPGNTIFPPETCDPGLFLVLSDTLFYNDSVMVPCEAVYTLDTDWKNIWAVTGQGIDSFLIQNNRYFKQVMIPVTDTTWFRSDFQFRFLNYGSLSNINSWKSNTDHWHIDEVYLNTGRSSSDIYSGEVRFVQPASSLLSGYTSIPSRHYNTDMMVDTIRVYANNSDSIAKSFTYDYFVQDEGGNYLPGFNYPGYMADVYPYESFNVNTYQPWAKIPVNSWFEYSDEEEVSYTVNHVIFNNDTTMGDTLRYLQRFSNYFAYDDGTAERGYGASADNTMIAVQFRTQAVDTLRGVQIYFNKTLGDYNVRNFHVMVWTDNNGFPGSVIFKLENQTPLFPDSNQFAEYIFQDTIIRLGVDVFYVGVIQTTDDNLNIGFDRNTNARSKTFYTTAGDWLNSPFDGSLMIRPLLGKELADTTQSFKSKPEKLTIYPNPSGSNEFVTLEIPGDFPDPAYRKFLTLRIFDYSGRKIFSSPFVEYLSISWLRPGFYIVDVFDAGFTKHYTAKMIIEKK